MKTFKNVVLGLLLCFTVASCCKCETKDETPSCIKERIAAIKSGNDDYFQAVYRYQYQGRTVYLFESDDQIADGASDVYDDHCNKLCQLGGIKGDMMCNGDNFYDKATNRKLVWKK